MEQLFLYSGITLFIAATMAASAYAFRESNRQGYATLFVPFAFLSLYHRDWKRYRYLALAHSLGLGLMLAAVALFWYQYQQYDIYRASHISTESREKTIANQQSYFNKRSLSARADRRSLEGRLLGQPFYFDQGELTNGQLRISHGNQFFPTLEVTLYLQDRLIKTPDSISMSINPDSTDVPQIHVLWRKTGSSFPTNFVFKENYWLELSLFKDGKNRLSGYMQLMLPKGANESLKDNSIAGEVSVYLDDLRYIGDQVDVSYDSNETLAYVTRHELKSLYPEIESVKRVSKAIIEPYSEDLKGSAMAVAILPTGDLMHIPVYLSKKSGEWRVVRKDTKTTDLVSEMNEILKQTPTSSIPEKKQPDWFSVKFDYLMSNFDEFKGKQVTFTTTNGGKQTGKLVSKSNTKLVVETKLNKGSVEYYIPFDEVESVQVGLSR